MARKFAMYAGQRFSAHENRSFRILIILGRKCGASGNPYVNYLSGSNRVPFFP